MRIGVPKEIKVHEYRVGLTPGSVRELVALEDEEGSEEDNASTAMLPMDRMMFEESLRMPMLLSYPAVLPGRRVHEGIVTNVDFAQTILEAGGVESHERMQGRSFWGDLTGAADAPPPTEGMYYRYWEHDDVFHHAPAHYGYRSERYQLIYYYNDGMRLPGTGAFVDPGEWELYDLEADPAEMRNVADDPAYADIRAALTVAMLAEQERLGDTPHPSQFGAASTANRLEGAQAD